MENSNHGDLPASLKVTALANKRSSSRPYIWVLEFFRVIIV